MDDQNSDPERLSRILELLGLREMGEKIAPVDHTRLGAKLAECMTVKTPSMPAAGPHARPELTDEDLTPGSGMLPKPGDADPNQQPSG